MRWILAALVLATGMSRGGEIWVDGETGKDYHDGTKEHPFATIEAGIAELTPGSVLHILPREKPWPGDIRIEVDGTVEKPIVIDGHGSLVSGRGELGLENWTAEGNGVYRRPLPNNAWGMRHHWEGGFPLVWFDGEPAVNVTSREALRPGTCFLYKNQAELKTDPLHNTLYIRPPEGGVSKLETIVGEGGIYVGGDHVTVRNFVVEFGGRDGFATHRNRGVVFENIEARYFMDQGMSHHGAEVVVRNAHFHSNAGAGVVDVYPEVRVRYESCLIENDTWRGGVEFHSGDFEMVDCVIRGNPKNSVTVIKGAKVRLENCLIEGSGPTGIRLNNGSLLDLKRCTIRGFPTALHLTLDSDTRFSSTESRFERNECHLRVDEVHRLDATDYSPDGIVRLERNQFAPGEWIHTVKRKSASGWKVESERFSGRLDPSLPDFLQEVGPEKRAVPGNENTRGAGWNGKEIRVGPEFGGPGSETRQPRD